MKLLKPSTWGWDPGAVNLCIAIWYTAFATAYLKAFVSVFADAILDIAKMLSILLINL